MSDAIETTIWTEAVTAFLSKQITADDLKTITDLIAMATNSGRVPQIITPKIFKELYAPEYTVESVRTLWELPDFPGCKFGELKAVVDVLAEKWLMESSKGRKIASYRKPENRDKK